MPRDVRTANLIGAIQSLVDEVVHQDLTGPECRSALLELHESSTMAIFPGVLGGAPKYAAKTAAAADYGLAEEVKLPA